jgi:hypothetical protein
MVMARDWPRDPTTGRVVLGAMVGRTTMAETVDAVDRRMTSLAFAARMAARDGRVRAHAERLAATARILGRLLARYEVTRVQVERRLDALIFALDSELADLVEVRLLDPDEGRRIAEAGLALGLKEAP